MSKMEEAMQNLVHSYEVTTIAAATKRWNQNDNVLHPRLCRQMVEYIADPENQVTGSTGEYHRLINAAINAGDYFSALRIAELGLQKYPCAINLLADAVWSAGDAGDFEQGEACLATLEQVGRAYWDWSAYRYAIDMLMAKLSCAAGADREQLVARLLQMCDDFVAAFPALDRAYCAKAQALIYVNRKADAERVLKEAIFNGSVAGEKPILAPQCCVAYLEKLLPESNDYDTIINVAMQGLIATATEENSANFGYFVYRIALAKDAQLVDTGFDNKDKVEEVLNWYQCAYDVYEGDISTPRIANRYLFVRQNSKYPIDRPLVKHTLALSDPEELHQRALALAALSAKTQSEQA